MVDFVLQSDGEQVLPGDLHRFSFEVLAADDDFFLALHFLAVIGNT